MNDIDIARTCVKKDISEVAESLGIETGDEVTIC